MPKLTAADLVKLDDAGGVLHQRCADRVAFFDGTGLDDATYELVQAYLDFDAALQHLDEVIERNRK